MSSILLNLPDLYNSYKTWISKNPQSASDLESATKWLSYFVAGRINKSHVLEELIYCLSNLLTFFNDRTICGELRLENPGPGNRIKVWLTTLKYSEVFLELSSKKLWGNRGKWLVIVCIQVFKCVARLILVYHYKERLIENPPISALQRHKCISEGFDVTKDASPDVAQMHIDSITFSLKHSGKLIRKVDSSPPTAFRTWKPIQRVACENSEVMDDVLAHRQLVAETVYILKPIIHLGSMSYFGTKAWKPWLLAFAMDAISVQLYRSCRGASANSPSKLYKQIDHRTASLLLYLLRSPFYDHYTKQKIFSLLETLSDHVPLAGFICKPLAQYLPFWQSNYFYMWST